MRSSRERSRIKIKKKKKKKKRKKKKKKKKKLEIRTRLFKKFSSTSKRLRLHKTDNLDLFFFKHVKRRNKNEYDKIIRDYLDDIIFGNATKVAKKWEKFR